MKRLALALILLVAPATAQDLRPEDAARLADFDASLGRGLRAALTGGAAGDVARLVDVLAGEAALPQHTDLSGSWNCRVMKLGGLLPLTIYPPFSCKVADGVFRKTGGSQRSEGVLVSDGGRILYLGVGYVAGESPPAYDRLPELTDPTRSPQHLPQVAIVEQTGPDTARLLFPAPFVESDFDVIEMTR